MNRREFIAKGVAAGTAIALGARSATVRGRNVNRAKFRMKYAPHFTGQACRHINCRALRAD